MFIASPIKAAVGNTAIPTARKYLGCILFPDGTNAATVIVYQGNAATGGKEVGAVRCTATESNRDEPPCPVELDPESRSTEGLFVVVAGTGAFALVRYST